MRALRLAGAALLAVVFAACSNGGDSGPSGSALAAPSGVTTAVVNGQVVVTWNPVAGATDYNIYMASQAGVTKLNHTTLTENMFHPDLTDRFDHPAGLGANTTYYFVVTAVRGAEESRESCEVTARIAGSLGGTC